MDLDDRKITQLIDNLAGEIEQILRTAKDNNKASYTRKDITATGLSSVDKLLKLNSEINKNFEFVNSNLVVMMNSVKENHEAINVDLSQFSQIIKNINWASESIDKIDLEIVELTKLVEDIKGDTNQIFSLALNASIVSSKYSQTSGVFDVLANKLSEMSHFINQNLENITAVVRPITDGINKLTYKNALVLGDFEKGYDSFKEFPVILKRQAESINDLLKKAEDSFNKVELQKKSLIGMNEQISAADKDASGAIEGSGNVARTAEQLREKLNSIYSMKSSDKDYKNYLTSIKNSAASIWQFAQQVNEKSKNQLDVSLKSVDFCDSLIGESVKLKETTIFFNEKTVENNNIAVDISRKLASLTTQIDQMKNNIHDSSVTIMKFNQDYKQIDDIIQFLKNILKTMRLLGMYSRIESARDPEKFSGFITISNNIIQLQDDIQNNIPIIEQNINRTHDLISAVNKLFDDISSIFYKIIDDSNVIIGKLENLNQVTTNTEEKSRKILSDSGLIDNLLTELKKSIINLTEVVKKPIEGSTANIKRGKSVENICGEILADIDTKITSA